jgi:hypothetical protein
MKTNPMKVKFTAAFWLAACVAWLMMPAASLAQVLATWQNDSGDGCLDWPAYSGNGYNGSVGSITNTVTTNQYSADLPIYTNVYSFAQNVVEPYAQSLQINEAGGWNQNLTLNLTFAQFQALTNNNLLSFTFSCPPGTGGGNVQIPQITFNSPSSWYTYTLSSNNCTVTGATSWDYDSWNTAGMPNFDYWDGSSARSQTVTLNYANLLPTLIANGWGYCQLIFSSYNGGGAPTYWYMNNVTLSKTSPQLVYTVDDFSDYGVGPYNPTNDDYFATWEDYSQGDISSVWSLWFQNGITGITFDPNVNVSGNTNANGAMAIALTWNGRANDGGYQQWIVWQGNSACYTYAPGTTNGIGYPQYTNLECDVMFDPSSLSCTNANGVLGVIRLGVRPFGKYSQDWEPQADYVTISDTNWYRINMPIDSSNPDYENIGAAFVGEDVSGYVDGSPGLVGNQLLYVANIRFTGPLVTPKIPSTKLAAPQPAQPMLRIFAGSTANTYDREELYTTDASQSWVDPGATFPVKYSYSLLDYNPNIEQVHLELIPGGSPGNEYADWGANNMLWMVLNPGPAAGQVVCSVQWKTNNSGSNPGGTSNPYGNALAFTNSTAVGTWTLVFTSTNTGYVIPPGQVILGPTNFTIADGTVVDDFADSMYAIFGIQANTTAGEGQYIDYGMISVSGVAGVNEFEDFTKEAYDISGNLTPSQEFDNSVSAMPASTIIVTTNDAPGGWWISWSQPAVNFTLASSTNLVNPNWINPAWYGGYSDNTAPRVLPLPSPFAQNFWVLLPKDDVPTANGQQNAAPPAAGPPAPTAFFLLSTNVVSP